MSSLQPNRAICDGDRARAGIGERGNDVGAVRAAMAPWSTQFLKSFVKTAKSDLWRKEAHTLILQREGISADIQNLNSKRARRKRRGSKQAQSFGRALLSP